MHHSLNIITGQLPDGHTAESAAVMLKKNGCRAHFPGASKEILLQLTIMYADLVLAYVCVLWLQALQYI